MCSQFSLALYLTPFGLKINWKPHFNPKLLKIDLSYDGYFLVVFMTLSGFICVYFSFIYRDFCSTWLVKSCCIP